MKVKRLVEDQAQYKELLNYGTNNLGLSAQAVDSIISPVKDSKLSSDKYLEYEDKLTDRADYSNVDVNAVRRAFENDNGLFKNNQEAAKAKLYELFDKVGHYGPNSSSNIKAVLDKFDFKFIKYFLECLDYENLGDKSNTILAALSNSSAPGFINGHKDLFIKLFNLANYDKLEFTDEYFKDPKALMFNNDLYRNVSDLDTLYNIIENDIKNIKNPKWREAVLANVKTGNLGQFSSKKTRQYREIEAITKTLKKLDSNEYSKVLKDTGVSNSTAAEAARQANEVNNKQ